MKRRVSSHDVARAAGVSQSTVSLVLSGREDSRISGATRERVLAAALELNYRRNTAARTLVTGRTQRIGIVANHPASFRDLAPYYGGLVAGITDGVLAANYNLLFHSAQFPTWETLCEDILGGGTDGVLLVGRGQNDVLTNALYDAQFPTVCISYCPDRADFYAADCDNARGGWLAAQHLIGLGHRHIAFTDGGPNGGCSWVAERKAGVERAFQEAGLSPALLISQRDAEAGFPKEAASEPLHWLLETMPRPTALIACDEGYAQEAAEGLPRFGVRVPQDFSIVGFNSTEVSARTRPPLTSVYQPILAIGAAAVAMLADLIEEKEIPNGARRFPVRLDIRESTCKIQ